VSHLIVTTEGVEQFLVQVRDYINGLPVTLHLFQNNGFPDKTWTLADVVEATVDGYAAVDVDSFGAVSDVGGEVWQTQADEVTFTLDGSATSQTIYGYYVTDQGDAQLFWAERFDTPFDVDAAAFPIPVLPTLTARSLFSTTP